MSNHPPRRAYVYAIKCYRGRAIVGPHLDLDALVEFAETHAEAKRA